MKNKLILTSLALFYFVSFNFAQEAKKSDVIILSRSSLAENKAKDYVPEIIPEYFLLGTISDYMGRYYFLNSNDEFDFFMLNEKEEKYAMYYLYDYIKNNFDTNINKGLSLDTIKGRIISLELAEKMNSFYDDKGILSIDIFKTDEQKYSFLLGKYLRARIINKEENGLCTIGVTNSPNKGIIYQLLPMIGCDKITYTVEDTIPTWTYFSFDITPKFRKYLKILEDSEDIFRKS